MGELDKFGPQITDIQQRGLLKLFPQWLTRNPNAGLNVVNWMRTKQGQDVLTEVFDTMEATTLLGALSGNTTRLSEEAFWEGAIPMARERGSLKADDSDQTYAERLRHSLDRAIEVGSIVQEGELLHLSKEAETVFIMSEAMRMAIEKEEAEEDSQS